MIAIYAIAGLVALVWGAIFVLRGSLLSGCLAFLIVAICFGHHYANFQLGPLTLTFDRLVLAILVGAYLVQRRQGRTEPKPPGRIDALVLAFLGVLVLSGCYGGWGSGGFVQTAEAGPLYRLVAGYLIPFAIYWMARQSPLDRSKLSLLAGTLTCLGVYLAVTGLLEIGEQWWAVFPGYIADPEVGMHFGRARGPMVSAISFGLYLGVCILAAWLWRSRHRRLGQLVTVALMPVMLAGIYFSYTRSVWMGAGLGLMIVLGLTLRGLWRPLVLGGMASAALLLAVTQMDKLKALEREQPAADSSSSVDLRVGFAYLSWTMFRDRPLWGVGFGQFPDAKLPYLADRSTSLNLEDLRPYCHHNTFLSILTETGLIGLGLFLAVLASWAWTAWNLVRDPQLPDWTRAQGTLLLGALGIYVCQLAFHEMSYSPVDNSLIFLLAGVTVGLRAAARPAANPASQGRAIEVGQASSLRCPGPMLGDV